MGTYITQNKICLTDGIIDQIIAEHQPKALSNWTGFAEKPTTKEDAIKAIRGIPKKFNIKTRKPYCFMQSCSVLLPSQIHMTKFTQHLGYFFQFNQRYGKN